MSNTFHNFRLWFIINRGHRPLLREFVNLMTITAGKQKKSPSLLQIMRRTISEKYVMTKKLFFYKVSSH